jgi:hypothetical protein
MVAAPLACLTVMLVAKPKRAFYLGAFTAALGAAILGLLTVATGGEAFRHLFLYNQNPFSFGRLAHALSDNYRGTMPVLALAVAGWAGAFFPRFRVQNLRWQVLKAWLTHSRYRTMMLVWSVFWIYSFLVSLAVGKEGSNYNYFLEWNLACCPLAGLVLFRVLMNSRGSRGWLGINALSYVLPIFVLVQASPAAIGRLVPPSAEALSIEQEKASSSKALVDLLRHTSGPIFSEDMSLLYNAGKDVPAEPAILQCLVRKGVWSEEPLLRMIDEHRFSLVVDVSLKNTERYTPTLRRAIERSYPFVVRRIGRYEVREPEEQFAHEEQ